MGSKEIILKEEPKNIDLIKLGLTPAVWKNVLKTLILSDDKLYDWNYLGDQVDEIEQVISIISDSIKEYEEVKKNANEIPIFQIIPELRNLTIEESKMVRLIIKMGFYQMWDYGPDAMGFKTDKEHEILENMAKIKLFFGEGD